MTNKAIILFSGGLDSTTCLAIAKEQGYDCYALTFAYGQKHKIEVDLAKKAAAQFNVLEHKILYLPLDEIRGSSLTDPAIDVPDYVGNSNHEIPNTYVPARNTIFLSFAIAWGEVIGAYEIFFGANFIDYSGYPDCRPDYIETFENLALLATKVGTEGQRFKVHTPLLYLHKHDVIREGLRLGIDYATTISCYRANNKGESCGKCDSCTYRKNGFAKLEMTDPTPYY